MLHISVSQIDGADETLHELLEHAATHVRREAGKPAPASTLSPEAEIPADVQSEP